MIGNEEIGNDTLTISQEEGKVYLPYRLEDIKNEAKKVDISVEELIQKKYIVPIRTYSNSIISRYNEAYKLMIEKEKKSVFKAMSLGMELMFEFNLHPAIISACRNLEELDVYLDCLDDNELEKFTCFKIVYKAVPRINKKHFGKLLKV